MNVAQHGNAIFIGHTMHYMCVRQTDILGLSCILSNVVIFGCGSHSSRFPRDSFDFMGFKVFNYLPVDTTYHLSRHESSVHDYFAWRRRHKLAARYSTKQTQLTTYRPEKHNTRNSLVQTTVKMRMPNLWDISYTFCFACLLCKASFRSSRCIFMLLARSAWNRRIIGQSCLSVFLHVSPLKLLKVFRINLIWVIWEANLISVRIGCSKVKSNWIPCLKSVPP